MNSATWTLRPVVVAQDVVLGGARVPAATQFGFLGHGLTTPFRRLPGGDFADAVDVELVKSALGQILGTRSEGPEGHGELRWRTEFGSRIHSLRHQKVTFVRRLMARQICQDAITRWEPRVRIAFADLVRDASSERAIRVHVLFHVVSGNPASNRVVLPNQALQIPLVA